MPADVRRSQFSRGTNFNPLIWSNIRQRLTFTQLEMETVFPQKYIYMYVCDEISIFVEFDIRYVFFFPPFFFDIRSKVHYSSPKKKKKNFTTHFSPPQLFNKFDPRLKFYLSDTQNREPIIPFFVDIFQLFVEKKLVFDYCTYICSSIITNIGGSFILFIP